MTSFKVLILMAAMFVLGVVLSTTIALWFVPERTVVIRHNTYNDTPVFYPPYPRIPWD